MGAIFKVEKLTTAFEAIILVIGLTIVLGGVYYFAPGLRIASSKTLAGLVIDKNKMDNVQTSAKMEIPSESPSTSVTDKPLIRIAEYAWNCNSGMIAANGGPRPTKGSLNEASGINLDIKRIDGVSDLRNYQLKFVEEFSKGVEYPTSESSAFAVSIMGDGVPFYIATGQQALDDKFGKGKYHLQLIAAIGMSDGEDKLIGPAAWKTNPQLMKGCLISSVIGDGDWVVAVNFASANGIKVNPDVKTYDPDAMNFTPSENDDYINSIKELIKSQSTGFAIPLKEVINGKLTGKTVNIKINGGTTWTPGDKMAFDALTGYTDVCSTKDFTNQMATSIIVVKEWAVQHEQIVTNLLKNTYTICNQIKQYDEWQVFASKVVAKTYNFETPKYWYDLFKGSKHTKNGVEYNIGGSRVLNYADAMQYFGITDGTNRYKAVYEQISGYLVDLNPCGFNESVTGGIIPYSEAVNLYFLKSITDVDAGVTKKADYTAEKKEVLATGEWHINFASGSANILTTKELETIYGLLVQAEQTKVKITGYTDNIGSATKNLTLSDNRANAIKTYLVNKGIPATRFQSVTGQGEANPIGDNNTLSGQAQNRRCEITLLK